MPGMSMPGMPGMSGSMPGMGGMMPGMSGSMPGMGGMMPGMGEECDGGMMSGMMDPAAGMGEGMMSVMMPGYGVSGNEVGYGGMSVATPGPSVPYLLIRFFDFTVEPGKKYRYRVKTLLEDPNHPMVPQLEPSERSLDPEVKVRLVGVATEEQEKKRRLPFRFTEFSEPSEPIGVEIEPQVLAGKIELQKTGAQLDTTQPKLALTEPQAKMLAVMWDDLRAVDVAAVSDVFRGTYLNFVSKGDAIHPVMLVYKMLENYGFTTNRLVADIRGGDALAGAEKEDPLAAPGEYALINADGELVVRTEFDDWQSYRRLALPEPPAEPTIPAYGSGGMGDADGGMMPGMPGYPGAGKGRGRSSRGGS
jgi:hypothetical protein